MTVVAVSLMFSPLAASTDSAPGGVAAPSSDSGAQRSSARVAGAVNSTRTPQNATRVEKCHSARLTLRNTIAERRAATYRWQTRLGYPHTRTAHRERTAIGCNYLRFLRRLWTTRADEAYRVWVSLRDPREAICHVFGIYCSEALAVARCESGGSMTPRAHNGQYLGLFQMGSYARRLYGHGDTVLEQARAAYRYFVASGRDWGPWSCRP